MADVGDTDCTKKRTPAWMGRTAICFVIIAPIAILAAFESGNATEWERLPDGRVATAALALGSSNGFLSGGTLMPATDTQSMDQRSDCTTRFTALVRDLDSVLASDPDGLAPVFEVFHKYFPVEKCKIDVVAIARASRFFVGSEEMGTCYNVAFSSAGVSSRPGFAVLITIDKKTGNLERPFAKVNGY